MRIIFAGTPETAVPTLNSLVSAGHSVAGVITREDAPVGRKRVLTPSPVAERAEELKIPVLKQNSLSKEAEDWVATLKPDLGVVVAYGGLLKEGMLKTPQHGWINIHFSLLPDWRGAAPVQRSIMAGDDTVGVTVFRLVEELDAGPILKTAAKKYVPGTSAGDVLQELAVFSNETILDAIKLLEADPAAGVEQSGETRYAHKLTREDGGLDFTGPATEVLNAWAGVTPAPGAWAIEDEKPIKIIELKASSGDSTEVLLPGEVKLLNKKVYIGTSSAPLELVRVQPSGKKVMFATDWFRGKQGAVTLK